MNVFTAVGNLGGDAEVRHTPTGKAITSFSVAVKSGWGRNEKTTWVKCGLWGKDGAPHGMSPYLSKGKQVAISGEIFMDEWTGQNGEKMHTLKCNIRDVTLCGPKTEAAPAPAPQAEPAAPAPGQDFDEDLPF